jgi:hypothetical protein
MAMRKERKERKQMKPPLRRVPDMDVGRERAPNKAALSRILHTYIDAVGRRYYVVPSDHKDNEEWVKSIQKNHPGCDFAWVSLPKGMNARDMPQVGEKITMPHSGVKRSVKEVSMGMHTKDRKTGWIVLTTS